MIKLIKFFHKKKYAERLLEIKRFNLLRLGAKGQELKAQDDTKKALKTKAFFD